MHKSQCLHFLANSITKLAGITLSIVNCMFVNYGYGHHQALVTQSTEDMIMSGQMAYVGRIMYQFVVGSTKLGLCAFYTRVFQDRRSKICIYILAGLVCAFTTPLLLYVIVRCRPSPGSGPVAICSENTPDIYISAICNILGDALLLVFAISHIRE